VCARARLPRLNHELNMFWWWWWWTMGWFQCSMKHEPTYLPTCVLLKQFACTFSCNLNPAVHHPSYLPTAKQYLHQTFVHVFYSNLFKPTENILLKFCEKREMGCGMWLHFKSYLKFVLFQFVHDCNLYNNYSFTSKNASLVEIAWKLSV